MKKNAIILLVACSIWIFDSRAAFAYLDPGTGAMMAQAVLGAIAIGLLALRSYWGRFKSLVGRLSFRREKGIGQKAKDT